MTVKNVKPWMAVGALVAASGLLVACGSSDGASGGMKDTTSDPDEMVELIEQGLAGEETVKCVGGDEDIEGQFVLASEEKFRFDLTGDGEAPSVLSTGDEGYMWVEGESTGVVMADDDVEMFQTTMIEQVFGGLSSSDMDTMDECGVYTGGDGVYTAPEDIDFLTIESPDDMEELEDKAPKLSKLMFG